MTKREIVYNKFGGRCAYCGHDLNGKFQVDHCIPQFSFVTTVRHHRFNVPAHLKHLTEGDVNHIDNLFPSCASCNKYKAGNPLEVFRSELAELVNRLDKYITQWNLAKRFSLVKPTGNPVRFYFETFEKL